MTKSEILDMWNKNKISILELMSKVNMDGGCDYISQAEFKQLTGYTRDEIYQAESEGVDFSLLYHSDVFNESHVFKV